MTKLSERRLQYMNEYRKRNKEKISEQKKKHYKKHRNYYLNYYSTHREHIKELAKACYRKHKAEGKIFNTPKAAEFAKQYRLRIKFKLFDILGKKCVHCGFSNTRALQIDHVHGSGNKHRKKIGRNHQYFLYVFNEIKNGSNDYQLLCANCNSIKKYEMQEMHQKKSFLKDIR